MNILEVNRLLRLITDNQLEYSIYTYENAHLANLMDKNVDQYIDIAKEVLFSIMAKISISRNFNDLQNIKINAYNQTKELQHNLEDCDSLFTINIRCRNNYIIYEGVKIHNGNCIVSKNELMNILNNEDIKLSMLNKVYYPINMSMDDYVSVLDNLLEIVDSNDIDNIIPIVENLIDKFVDDTVMPGRIFVADLIVRDYHNLLKHEIDRLENDGYSICKINNNKIFYI